MEVPWFNLQSALVEKITVSSGHNLIIIFSHINKVKPIIALTWSLELFSMVKHTKQLDLRETLKTKMSEGTLVIDYVWKMIYHLNTLKILVAQISNMSQ